MSLCSRICAPPLVVGLLVVSLLAGCSPEQAEDLSIRPAWYSNQEFHLESRYRKMSMKSERGNDIVDPEGPSSESDGTLEDEWSEPVYWRYQVLHQGFVPEPGSDFYPFAAKGGTNSALTVIKASLDPTMNLGGELRDADPKIYLVIREDRLRLAGLVHFYSVAGERLSQAMTVDDEDMNRSYNLLSQSNLAAIPHFIPPFPISREEREMVLEDGQVVSFTNATATGIDVVYENNLDGTLISDCWEDGLPWATLSSTPTLESRLMSADEVADLSGPLGGTFDEGEDEEDFDFVARLKEAVNLSDNLFVDELVGTHSYEVQPGYRPWAGSWWRQSEAALVFGHSSDGAGSLVDLHREAFEAPAVTAQNLGDELREMRRNGETDSEDWDEKLATYRDAQAEMKDELARFTAALQAGLDGGMITLSEGRLAAEENWNQDEEAPYPAFDLEVDGLSAMGKIALIEHMGESSDGRNPWDILSWELLNHWSPAGSSWWGHCNGWSAAAILTHEPREPVTVSFGAEDEFSLELSTADQKGLLTESFYSQLSNFYGARYNDNEGDDISDLSPKAVLQLLGTTIAQRGVPLVFDTSANEQVWNFPAWAYQIELTETTDEAGADEAEETPLLNLNTASIAELAALDGLNDDKAGKIVRHREMNGPFQELEDLKKVEDIDWDGGWFSSALFEKIAPLLTVELSAIVRSFEGLVRVKFATDGVGYEHIDADPEAPEGFSKVWSFTLEADPDGRLISGEWLDPEAGHPDFAWVPYSNTEYAGRSENPYLSWALLQDSLPALLRQ
jgi:competence ComEA-like helix-hairpin-helix protein